MDKCSEPGCEVEVAQAGHTLCLEHYKQRQNGSGFISATDISHEFELKSPAQVNRVLKELGWVERSGRSGWRPTVQGLRLQAKAKQYPRGADYVLWPKGITKSSVLRRAIDELVSIEEQALSASVSVVEEAPVVAYGKQSFAEKYPAPLRTSDGHMVRSQGEIIIDNWLYEQRIVHSYEKLVPIEEPMRCDFYLPEIGVDGVYVEYWGMESSAQYKERKQNKIALYEANGLKLIEVHAKDIGSLDEVLQPALIKFGWKAK